MSQITSIYWFIKWECDPDYQNFPNYLNDNHPWIHIIPHLSKFPKLPKCPKLTWWSTDSLSDQMTQITKISQITFMTTILELILFSNDQNFQKYLNVRNYQIINWFIIWANDPDYQNFPNYQNNHKHSTHINDLNSLNYSDYQNYLHK